MCDDIAIIVNICELCMVYFQPIELQLQAVNPSSLQGLLREEEGLGLVGIWSKPKGSVACTARYRRRGREANRIRDAIDENICARDDDQVEKEAVGGQRGLIMLGGGPSIWFLKECCLKQHMISNRGNKCLLSF